MIQLYLNIPDRKQLVTRMKELTGLESRYTFMPRCAYEIGSYTVDKEGTLTVEEADADKDMLRLLIDEGWVTGHLPQDEKESVLVEIAFPMEDHTGTSLRNLVNLVYSRGELISKAVSGKFSSSLALVHALAEVGAQAEKEEILAVLREHADSLIGIRMKKDKVVFCGFPADADSDYVSTFLHLAEGMNRMALEQKRIQAKTVDTNNEKYALRIWLLRIGLGGKEYKADRKRLMNHLSGHTAFRTPEAQEKAKRKAQSQRNQTAETER